MKTYCTNDDMVNRLDIPSEQTTSKSGRLDSCRERAYRWIVSEFTKYGEDAPDPTSSLDAEVLQLTDIEADYACYLFRRDHQEFSSDDEATDKLYLWKKDSREELDRLLRNLYGDKKYGVIEGW